MHSGVSGTVPSVTAVFAVLCAIALVLTRPAVAKINERLKCKVGYGQVGRNHKQSHVWETQCPKNVEYCYKAWTDDVKDIEDMFEDELDWDEYYDRFWVKGCGGMFGAKETCPTVEDVTATNVKVIGDTGVAANFTLNYCCFEDLCGAGVPSISASSTVMALCTTLLGGLLVLLLY